MFLALSLYILTIVTYVVTLTYLGWSFSSKDVTLDSEDWRRKWLIFFAWFYLVSTILYTLLALGGAIKMKLM